MKKRERGKEREKEEKKKENEKTSHPTTDGETNVTTTTTTTHPVASANYIMIFNGPKSKTWPPKIFGRGVG